MRPVDDDDACAERLCQRRREGAEDDRFDLCDRSLCSDGVAEVAAGRAADRLEPELDGCRDRDRSDAVLERIGRVLALELQVQIDPERVGQPRRANERRPPGTGAGITWRSGKEPPVPPERRRAGGDRLLRQARAKDVPVVRHVGRPVAALAGDGRAGCGDVLAHATTQCVRRHRLRLPILCFEPSRKDGVGRLGRVRARNEHEELRHGRARHVPIVSRGLFHARTRFMSNTRRLL
jgi:hypothetical protein